MNTSVNVSGGWNSIKTGTSVHAAGGWQSVKAIWANVSGTWQQVWAALSAVINDQYLTGNSSIAYRADSDGKAKQNVNNGGYTDIETWMGGGTGIDYEFRATMVSGTTPTGTFDAWGSLQYNWSYTLSASPGQFRTCIFTAEIRRASDGAVLDSASITLEADNT